MGELSDLLKKMKRVQEAQKSDFQTLVEKANRVRASQKVEREEPRESEKPKVEVIPWEPDFFDHHGDIIRVLIHEGRLCRVYRKFGNSHKSCNGFNFTWSSNSATYLELRKLDDRSWRLRYEAQKIPRERALVKLPIALLPEVCISTLQREDILGG